MSAQQQGSAGNREAHRTTHRPAYRGYRLIAAAVFASMLAALLLLPASAFGQPQTASSSTRKHTAAHHAHTAAARHAASSKTASAKSASARKSKTASAHRGTAHRAEVSTRTRRSRARRHHLTAKELAKSHRLQSAFVASSQLRPMAQQLAQMRTPAAYHGVSAWAHAHTGEAAAAAYLALGHAYLLDKNFPEAIAAFHSADAAGHSLDDYADYLTAQAYLQSNQSAGAEAVLSGFDSKHPDSIFVNSVPVLEANLFLQEGDPQSALKVLNAHRSDPLAGHADYQLALAKAQLMAGNAAQAGQGFRHVWLDYPLSLEAGVAHTQLASSGILATLPVTERRRHADALYAAHRYSDAGDEYRALANDSSLSSADRNTLLVAAASCDWKLNRLKKSELDNLPDSNDEAGARRLYLLMELARDKDDGDTQRSLVTQMETRFPQSPWLAEALYSSGNMYLLRKDYPSAIGYYGELAKRFPRSCEPTPSADCSNYSPSSHWRAGWLNYRIGQYSEAARLFDEQIRYYAGGKEIPSALYWRARIYQDQEHNPALAAEYYRTVIRLYPHYYYATIAQDRLRELGQVTPEPVAALDALQPDSIPELTDDVPNDDPHVVKARLLANAGLNEYIAPEIQAADGSHEWGAFAEAEIYASYGESWRAMRLLKRAIPFYTSAPIEAIPVAYWRILFPQSYWSDIRAQAEKNGLDPYMVASLIRQETEFNPGAVSGKSAYGLMQLLPSVGRSMAKEEGIHHFRTTDLLDPETNIRLGTLYLRQTLDKFGGHPEYAFAAYNAGDNRVEDWQTIGTYHGMDEFVESIPFTETREYVQAILRNEEIYRELDKMTSQQASLTR
ncbi:transglycosylase SLT domain-containing protein [Paracidobacterium acidisoli]|uniref:Lytic transglycosylase n=1 Tax=Paracidobacterium acidisoli TaxID=2303751 RepID=A0A372IKM4_9BACT|nr:transglycosylase SLT domain-containing protein [Paracidobacterium acidisoli]MBT9332682.1 transglycosylase SLT domain-containing protein [Paracidobacterium acidisoli]